MKTNTNGGAPLPLPREVARKVSRTDAYIVRAHYRDGGRTPDTFHDVRRCAEREANACAMAGGVYERVKVYRVAPFGYATRRIQAEGAA